MFKLFAKNDEPTTSTQELIDAANSHLFTLEPTDPKYDETLKQIERLHKLATIEKGNGFRVSADAMFAGAISLASILVIVSYEHLHPIISKAVTFVPKVKI